MSYKLSSDQIRDVVWRGARALVDYCQEASPQIHYVVTGSSGGLDSAVTLAFAERATQIASKQGYNLTSVGLIMPCFSRPKAELLGRKAIQKFGAREIFIDLVRSFNVIFTDCIITGVDRQIKSILEETDEGLDVLRDEKWNWSQRVAQGNVKARLRMIIAFHVARMMKGMVLSTDNLSEFWMGFWTLHGDVGNFGIIQNIMKGREMYDIARYLGVPREIINAVPDDGLNVTSGGDETQLGAPYHELDKVMVNLIQQGFDVDGLREQLKELPEVEDVSKPVVISLAHRCLTNAFKRKDPCVLTREELGLPPLSEIKL